MDRRDFLRNSLLALGLLSTKKYFDMAANTWRNAELDDLEFWENNQWLSPPFAPFFWENMDIYDYGGITAYCPEKHSYFTTPVIISGCEMAMNKSLPEFRTLLRARIQGAEIAAANAFPKSERQTIVRYGSIATLSI